jgi:hypothetical protein
MAERTDLEPSVSSDGVSSIFESLSAGVPLTLLMDLAPSSGPDSDAIFTDELPDNLDWIPAQRGEPLAEPS